MGNKWSRLFPPNLSSPRHFFWLVSSKNGRRGSHRFSATLIRTSCENWPHLRWIVFLCRAIAWSMKATVLGRWEDGWFGSNSKFPGGKLPWAWYNLEGGWNDEKECWGWFEIQNLKVNPETPPKQHWLSKHPSNHKDVFHFLGCVWHFGWRPLDSHDFLSMLFRGVCLTSGEVGNSMFILLNGSADVFVPDLRWRIGHRKYFL